jgi:hypothetical protein
MAGVSRAPMSPLRQEVGNYTIPLCRGTIVGSRGCIVLGSNSTLLGLGLVSWRGRRRGSTLLLDPACTGGIRHRHDTAVSHTGYMNTRHTAVTVHLSQRASQQW